MRLELEDQALELDVAEAVELAEFRRPWAPAGELWPGTAAPAGLLEQEELAGRGVNL